MVSLSNRQFPSKNSTKNLFLAIDQGGHATRAYLFDRRGDVLTHALEKVETLNPREDWVEHDPEEMVSSVECAVKKVFQNIGERAKTIVSAGLSTQRSNTVCWDNETGRALSPVISWQDRRAASWMEKFSSHNSLVHDKTGLFITAHYGASKLRWCMDNLPDVKEAFEKGSLSWGPMASFLIFRLLEERPLFADPANASRTLLWNVKSLNWDNELLDLFDLPEKPLPSCVPTRYSFGSLNIDGVKIPLKIVNGDQSSALFAYGLPQNNTAYINVGTGAFVQRPFNKYKKALSQLLTSVVLQEKDMATYVLEGTVNGAGSALNQVGSEMEISHEKVREQLPEWLNRAKSPPLFLNGVSGLGSPFWIPDFESRFIGEGENREKIVGVIESILFLLQVNLNEMRKLLAPPEKIFISGGLAMLDGICCKLADLSGIPVYRPEECEATAKGLGYLLAESPEWKESRPGEWFKPGEDPELKSRYERWLNAMKNEIGNIKSS